VQTPILLRIAFHDAGTYVAADNSGGPNGSVQFELRSRSNRAVPRRFGWPIVEQVCASFVP
jgi:catalase (peroxidase I)